MIKFVATEAGTSEIGEHVQSVGVTSGEEYLLFSRSSPDLEDMGVYLEYSDQLNAGYECIRLCSVSPSLLQVELSQDLGSLEEVEGFYVQLEMGAEEVAALVSGLKEVFRGKYDLLHVEV